MQGGSNPERIATNATFGHTATAQSVARILREFREIQRNPSPHWCANPLSQEEPYEWHFTLRGPPDSHFEGGLYHGRIVLPKNYPFGPPSMIIMTQNGRFEVNKKICLSASSYHPELWQPAWGIRTLLDALCAFFPTPGEGALRALDTPEKIRRRLAVESVNWTCSVCKRPNRVLVEGGCAAPVGTLPAIPDLLLQQPDAELRAANAPSELDPLDVFTSDTSVTRASASGRAAAISACKAGENGPPQTPPSRIQSRRQRPQRGRRALLAQLFHLPSTRGQLLITVLDVLCAFIVVVFVLVLMDVVVNPPKLKFLPNTGSGRR